MATMEYVSVFEPLQFKHFAIYFEINLNSVEEQS
jgi:hypothetical protein